MCEMSVEGELSCLLTQARTRAFDFDCDSVVSMSDEEEEEEEEEEEDEDEDEVVSSSAALPQRVQKVQTLE